MFKETPVAVIVAKEVLHHEDIGVGGVEVGRLELGGKAIGVPPKHIVSFVLHQKVVEVN